MRLAVAAPRIPERRECAPGPIDVEWLLERDDDLTVLVDHETPGSQRLRDAGISVLVSPKRDSVLPDGSELSADAVQARNLARLHGDAPFDAIIYDSATSTDFAWFEPELRAVPRGVALGGGPVADLGVVVDDAALFQHFGRAAWAGTGSLAGADFLLSDVPASVLGLRDELLPPTFGTGSRTTAAAAPGDPPRLVTVVACAERASGLATIINRLAAAVPIDEGTTVAVVHRDVRLGADTARQIILGGCPAALEQSVVLATPDQDGVAAGLLAGSDLVVAASPAELAVRAVATAPAGVLLLAGTLPDVTPLTAVPDPAVAPRVVLLPVDGSPTAAAEILARFEEADDADVVVLHSPALAAEARRLLGLRSLAGTDLGVLALAEPIYGAPLPDTPCLEVLAVGRGAWPSIRARLARVGSLGELVVWCLGLGLAEHVRLLVLPGSGLGFAPLPVQNVLGLPPWLASTGILPRPNLAGVAGLDAAAPIPPSSEGLKAWAQSHGWKDRVQLALPWRWGLLEKAMKDVW